MLLQIPDIDHLIGCKILRLSVLKFLKSSTALFWAYPSCSSNVQFFEYRKTRRCDDFTVTSSLCKIKRVSINLRFILIYVVSVMGIRALNYAENKKLPKNYQQSIKLIFRGFPGSD